MQCDEMREELNYREWIRDLHEDFEKLEVCWRDLKILYKNQKTIEYLVVKTLDSTRRKLTRVTRILEFSKLAATLRKYGDDIDSYFAYASLYQERSQAMVLKFYRRLNLRDSEKKHFSFIEAEKRYTLVAFNYFMIFMSYTIGRIERFLILSEVVLKKFLRSRNP
ncbi:hypothetical protein NPIL_636811 [Nephila pilipes]|uniref:Uncharacterized protein n=1 Tax=Nephila pilipes TaxID=299642 RepID=A0A8X6KBQ8_NEPPI|nr:hypothetical protein NPIL_636811 [Nephila pilipes]